MNRVCLLALTHDGSALTASLQFPKHASLFHISKFLDRLMHLPGMLFPLSGTWQIPVQYLKIPEASPPPTHTHVHLPMTVLIHKHKSTSPFALFSLCRRLYMRGSPLILEAPEKCFYFSVLNYTWCVIRVQCMLVE